MLYQQFYLGLKYRVLEQERLDEVSFTTLFCNCTIYLDVALIYRKSIPPK